MPECIPDRMSEDMSYIMIECQNICQIECQIEIECQNRYMADRLSEYSKYCISPNTSWHVMVGITQSKVIPTKRKEWLVIQWCNPFFEGVMTPAPFFKVSIVGWPRHWCTEPMGSTVSVSCAPKMGVTPQLHYWNVKYLAWWVREWGVCILQCVSYVYIL